MYRQHGRHRRGGSAGAPGYEPIAAVLALPVVAIGFWPALTSWLTEPAGAALLAVFGG